MQTTGCSYLPAPVCQYDLKGLSLFTFFFHFQAFEVVYPCAIHVVCYALSPYCFPPLMSSAGEGFFFEEIT